MIALRLHEASLTNFDARWALAHPRLVMHLAGVDHACRIYALAIHSGLLVGGRATAEGELEELDSLLVLKHVPLL